MNKVEKLEKLKKFLDNEYENTKEYIKDYPNKNMVTIIQNSISRCFGAVMFSQHIGITYEECGYYDIIRDKLLALLDE